VIQHLAIVRR